MRVFSKLAPGGRAQQDLCSFSFQFVVTAWSYYRENEICYCLHSLTLFYHNLSIHNLQSSCHISVLYIQSPATASFSLTTCPSGPQRPHLSASDSIEISSGPWVWMSMHSDSIRCIYSDLCLQPLPPPPLHPPPHSHYSHFQPSLRTINNAARSSSSSICAHIKHIKTHKQAKTHCLENTYTHT